eukprot:TRINITY_DN31071_c0_g1_i1.p1 TRINITY_DN31071_c0_g1~~TRINITY_DN31071_c0_g1_i1.p1  ORF type:complete len:323 (+),score=48.66 TRINITY_DN31071_c0_g1_i1:127-1095(+)
MDGSNGLLPHSIMPALWIEALQGKSVLSRSLKCRSAFAHRNGMRPMALCIFAALAIAAPWDEHAHSNGLLVNMIYPHRPRHPITMKQARSSVHLIAQQVKTSLWHDIGLHVPGEAEFFQYVSEVQRGTYAKLELQTHEPFNVIQEDVKGTEKIRAFGQPVPFNYGCFPQTFRDPWELCSIYNVSGDADPLDVIDLSMRTVGAGSIVRCRPIGAVCLLDGGKADWKVFVVNVDDAALVSARSVEDVERLLPGKVEEAMKWIDGLKQCTEEGEECWLYRDIHDAEVTLRLIENDHRAWQRLTLEAGQDGRAHGHWIRPPSAELA